MTFPRFVFRRVRAALLAACLIGGAAAWPARAQTAQASKPEPPKLKLTFSERIREETSDNVAGLNDSTPDGSAYVRFRTSLGLVWRPWEAFEISLRLTNENRYYLSPKSDPKSGRNYDPHEAFLDSLSLRWSRPLDLPLTITAGRQDIMFGEGFIIWDGGPLDGSRSAYFNALRLDWNLGRANTLSLFALLQPRTDTLLPVIRDRGQALVEQEEAALGAYFVGKAGKTGIDAYMLFKQGRAFSAYPELSYILAGARASAPLLDRLSLTAEAAGQSGGRGEADLRSWGGHFHLDYKTKAVFPLPAGLTLGALYLSGDDLATTGVYEGWDPAFARWPKWSESMIYLLGREGGRPAYWSNYASLFTGLQFGLADNVRLLLNVHRLLAPQATTPSALWSGTGRARGHLLNLKLQYDISQNLAGHLVWDQFQPGNFYAPGADAYAWVRFELLFRY